MIYYLENYNNTRLLSFLVIQYAIKDINHLNRSHSHVFAIKSLLHTKFQVEELFKNRQLPQCQNCQNYGCTPTYCAYTPNSREYRPLFT